MSIRTRALASFLSVALVWTLTPIGAIAGETDDATVPNEEAIVSSEGGSLDGQLGEAVGEGEVTEGDPSQADSEGDPAEGQVSDEADPQVQDPSIETPSADDTPDEAVPATDEEQPGLTVEGDDKADAETPEDSTDEAKPEEEEEKEAPKAVPTLKVTAHVQDIGWQKAVGSGQMAGTSGRSKRVEALKLSLEGKDIPSGSIEYRAHVQNIGWQSWVKDGAIAGTSGRGLRIEALKIRLTGEVADLYDIYYQIHVQNVGWMGIAKNGEATGTSGRSLRVEALRVWLVPKEGGKAPSSSANTKSVFLGNLGLETSAHVQNIGWMAAVGSGKTAGTTGRSLRVEAFKLNITGLEVSGGITYQAHVQNVGWQGWKSNGQVAGTSGRSLRVEAFRAKLTGDMANKYDLYYRVHVSNIGWLAWAKNGDTAGTVGMSERVEALQVVLADKGSTPSLAKDAAVSAASLSMANINYASWVQNTSAWQKTVSNGSTSGTTGRALWIEGMKATLSGLPAGISGGVQYRACLQGGSWTSWGSNGSDVHASGKRVEAIQFKLTGDAAKVYDVWYRAHVQGVGWAGWTKNGSSAGSTGLSRRVEAIQVRLVAKGGSAPGETYRPLVTKDNLVDAMTRKAQGYSSPTSYLIMIDCRSNWFGVYRGSRGNWNRVKYVRCSSGAGNNTVLGTFSVGAKGYSSTADGHTLYYYTDFYAGAWAIHSVLYYPYSNRVLDGRLGYHISGGCIRLDIKEAKWVYSNVPYGSTVVTYK